MLESPGNQPRRTTDKESNKSRPALTLESLDQYPNSSESTTEHLDKLKLIISDMVEWLHAEANLHLWTQKIFTQTFISSSGRSVKGFKIIADLAIAWHQENKPDKKTSAQDIVDHYASASLFTVLEEIGALDKSYETPQYELEEVDISHLIKSGFAQKNEKALADIENVLDELLEKQFHGDVLSMSESIIKETKYGPDKKNRESGQKLLEEYSVARWMNDHLNEKPARKNILKTDRYKPHESLQSYRVSKLQQLAQLQSHITIDTPDLNLRNLKECIDYELAIVHMLKYLTEKQRNNPSFILNVVQCKVSESETIPLYKLVSHYQHKRYREENPTDTETTNLKITATNGYKPSEAIRKLCLDYQLIDDAFPDHVKDFTDEQIKSFADLRGIKELLDCCTESDPVEMVKLLSLLRDDPLQNRHVGQFVARYVGLGGHKAIGGGFGLPVQVDSVYLRAIFILMMRDKDFSLDAFELKKAKELLKNSFRKELQSKGQEFVDTLRQDAHGLLSDESEQLLSKEQLQLFSSILEEIADDFDADLKSHVVGAITTPFNYQLEAIRFLTSRKRGMVADDAGLGKSLIGGASALTVGARCTLWITPASNKENIRIELLQHFDLRPEEVIVIDNTSKKKRAEVINVLNGERFIITNYAMLARMKNNDPALFKKLTEHVDAAIIDEGQLTDNPKTARTKAIIEIDAEYIWYLTATPYQNKVGSLPEILCRLDPETFPSPRAVRERYCQDTQGLIRMYVDSLPIFLRRNKDQIIETFVDPNIESFESQLANGRPRIPKLERLNQDTCQYDLSLEQQTTIAWMISDFRGWAVQYNAGQGPGEELINLVGINPLSKFTWLQKAIYQPELLGLASPTNMLDMTDKFIEDRIVNKGEKVITWVWNRAIADNLTNRYAKYGSQKFDGSIAVEDRQEIIDALQESPDHKLLIGNYRSGGVGLTLTGATTALVLQPPFNFPSMYQLEGRHHRVIGLNNVRHAKEKVYVAYAVPQFTDAFVQNLPDSDLAEILSHGTLAEQTVRRLEGGRVLYRLATEGIASDDDIDRSLKSSLFKSLGLLEHDSYDFLGGLKPSQTALYKVAEAFAPLWEQVQDDPELSSQLGLLINQGKFYPNEATEIATTLQRINAPLSKQVLETVTDIFALKNNFVRSRMLTALPKVISAHPKIFSNGTEDNYSGSSLIDNLPLFTEALWEGQLNNLPDSIYDYARSLRDTPEARRTREELLLGISQCSLTGSAADFLSKHSTILSEGDPEKAIHTIYQVGSLQTLSPEVTSELTKAHCDSFSVLSKIVSGSCLNGLERFSGATAGSAVQLIKDDPRWSQEKFDQLLTLTAAQVQQSDKERIDQAKEVIGSILDATFAEKRGQNSWGKGIPIEYKRDDKDFWESFNKNITHKHLKVDITPADYTEILIEEFDSLRREVAFTGPGFEGKAVTTYFNDLNVSSVEARENILKACTDQSTFYGKALGEMYQNSGVLSAQTKKGLEQLFNNKKGKVKIGTIDEPKLKEMIREKKNEAENLREWLILDQEFHSLKQNGSFHDPDRVKESLARKERHYQLERVEGVALDFSTVSRLTKRFVSSKSHKTKLTVTIEETDDPSILTRIGALSPTIVNCFNPNGNPEFNFWAIGAAASRNYKAIIVRDEATGEIIAYAPEKLRSSPNGSPVLFLERGLSELPYNFRREIMELVNKKAQIMTEKGFPTAATSQVFGRSAPGDTVVYGTGAYTKDEYAEAVFHLRNARRVQHAARPYLYDQIEETQEETTIGVSQTVGIGTSNKSIGNYLSELREMEVKVVVDVRGTPRSRYYPHFNRKALKQQLENAGIKYVWMGETLSNPKNSRGKRTLTGFRKYQKTDEYQEGFDKLRELIEGTKGVVALTCSEAKEADCHRKFILEDLRDDSEPNLF